MNKHTLLDDHPSDSLQHLVVTELEAQKAIDVNLIDVTGMSPLADFFVIASGSSTRHVKSMADNLTVKAKAAGHEPLGIEGGREAEWVLVDLNDVIVHLMMPQTRAFYNLEKLWEASQEQRSGATSSA